MRTHLFTAAAISVLLAVSAPAQAETKVERIAFQFAGTCSVEQRHLLSALSSVAGVRSIDLMSVPDHALVDIDVQLVSSHDLANSVRQTLHDSTCRAEPMESCISATIPHRITDASGPVDGPNTPH